MDLLEIICWALAIFLAVLTNVRANRGCSPTETALYGELIIACVAMVLLVEMISCLTH